MGKFQANSLGEFCHLSDLARRRSTPLAVERKIGVGRRASEFGATWGEKMRALHLIKRNICATEIESATVNMGSGGLSLSQMHLSGVT